jgi:hypothetical protein
MDELIIQIKKLVEEKQKLVDDCNKIREKFLLEEKKIKNNINLINEQIESLTDQLCDQNPIVYNKQVKASDLRSDKIIFFENKKFKIIKMDFARGGVCSKIWLKLMYCDNIDYHKEILVNYDKIFYIVE